MSRSVLFQAESLYAWLAEYHIAQILAHLQVASCILILIRFASRQQLEFLAVLRFDRFKVAAVGREDAAYLQPFGESDDGGIDEADI